LEGANPLRRSLDTKHMTLLFPRSDSAELISFAAPFGRMMLAFGRASAAVMALVKRKVGTEKEAEQIIAVGSKYLPKRLRRLPRRA
jgi:hypothetical protein